MQVQIAINDTSYSFDFGESHAANEACRGIAIYETTQKYGDLRRVFADLSGIISEGNPSNVHACNATRILAQKVFPTLNDYEKLFVAIAVTSIYEKASISVPADWVRIQAIFAQIISRELNQEKALNAGLACINPVTGQVVSQPIPEYSL